MRKKVPNTVNDFSRFAAERFLKTAVFVDDRIYDRKTGTIPEPELLQLPTPARKPALRSSQESTSKVESKPLEDTLEYSPHDVLTSFAKKRIVCSLYQPKKGASVGENSDVYQLCLASDVVIVDWNLYGDSGTKALELIEHLIKQSLTDIPEQLRLVLIYTNEPNLFNVSSQVYDRLEKLIPNKVKPQKDGLALHTPNARVVVLAKSGVRLEKYKAYEVSELQLADRAIAEFASLASGVLQAAVLLGLAEIRQNSRKVVSKFDDLLDPAFLTHFALCLPDSASDHVIPLIVAEIQSVLEDQLPLPILSKELVENWCTDVWKPSTHSKTAAGAKDANVVAKSICGEGPDSVKAIGIKGEKLYSFLLNSGSSDANHRLGILMSQRTHYDQSMRRLQLGTILRGPKGTYYVCLQPVCDCVRIDGEKSFLLASFDKSDESTNGRFNTVVYDNGKMIELYFAAKVYNGLVDTFRGGASKEVEASIDKDDFVFQSASGQKYVWVAQLKPDHAQRVAVQFASELSRVGLTESEWLREKGKK